MGRLWDGLHPSTARTAARSPGSQELKTKVHRKLIETIDLAQAQRLTFEELRQECLRRVDVLVELERCPLSAAEKKQVVDEVMDEVFGLGPLEGLMRDPTISDILANGAHKVYIERNGVLELTSATFRDQNHLLQVIQRIASHIGRRVDESAPMLDARLSDGSRVNAIIPPLALDGPMLSIRRFGKHAITIDRLLALGAMTAEIETFLRACVISKVNILISGGTGTGKTTLLNALSQWIPVGERVVTIEDAAELQLQREHVVRLETRPPNIEGKGEVTQRDLLRNSLRMRPDRIVIGEVRGAEALDMLQAMNTGHEGSMTTVHANNPWDALRRIENMVSMAGLNYPVQAIREQMVSALHLVIQVGRLTGGRRKLLCIVETRGVENGAIRLQELFHFKQTGVGADGHAVGEFSACGHRPHLLERLAAQGVELPDEIFEQRRACPVP
ncbi:MAG: CpaF family protein [Planctomycetota bacterium]